VWLFTAMVCSIWLLAAILLKVIHGHVVNICCTVCCALWLVFGVVLPSAEFRLGSARKLQIETLPNGLFSIVPLEAA
jgi:hypothetical protein